MGAPEAQEVEPDAFEVFYLTETAGRNDIDAIRARCVLLLPEGATAVEAGVSAAVARLVGDARLGAVVELRGGEGASVPLDAILGGAPLQAILVRADLLRMFVAEEIAVGLRSRLDLLICIAAAFDVARAELPLSEGGRHADLSPEDRRSLARAVFGLFALEDLDPGLRATPRNLVGLAQAALDFAARLFGVDALAEGFAVGSYATALVDCARGGESLNLNLPPGRVPCIHPYPSPLVSIVLPTYDRPWMLARALRSLRAQIFQDFEVILVNDAGLEPDGLGEFRSAIAGGGRLTVVSHDRNRGLAAARNTGLRLARGRYVGFLDDDDVLLPNHLSTLVPPLLAGERVVHGDCRRISEVEGDAGVCHAVETTGLYADDYDPVCFQLDNLFPVHSILIERELVLEAGGFDESLPVLEDWDLWRRAFLLALPVHVRRVTSEVRSREAGGNMTARNEERWLEVMARVYEKSIEMERIEPPLRAARVRHLIANAREREIGFPRGASVWLAGGGELLPIDPDDPGAYLDAVAGKPTA